jgi:hypothetical protein
MEVTMTRLSNNEEQHAQHIACGHLVRGCETAILELQAAPGETGARPQTKQRAEEILAQVLSSWRYTMSVVAPSQTPLSNGDTMDDWTSDELFAEALARRAGDAPALRLMQAQTLKAQLTAHDRGPAAGNLTN